MRQFIFISLLFLGFSLNAQTSTAKDTLAKYTYDELSEKFYAAKPDSLKAVNYAKYYVDKAKREKDTLEQADGNYYLSDITKDSIYFVSYWNEIIEETKKLNNKLYPTISYFELGDYYFQKGIMDKTVKYYLSAHSSSIKAQNDSLKYIAIYKLGSAYSNAQKFNKATMYYKRVYTFFKDQEKSSQISDHYFSVVMNLSTNYMLQQKYDSAIYYNKKHQLLALKNNDSTMLGYSINVNGKIQLKKKNYTRANFLLKQSIPFLITDENYLALSTTYKSIAKTYSMLNDENNALKYFLKVDSLFLKKGSFFKSQKPAYKYLVNYYKKDNNITKQLEYINKYIKVDSILNTRERNISKTLTENYDIPNILAEKKLIENRLKENLSTTKKWVLSFGTLALLLSFFLIHQTRKRKTYKKRFEELMNASVQVDSPKEATIAKKENTIPKETIENILNLLLQFEKNHDYIAAEITLSSLAKTFETNSKYLSQLINQYKGKSFNNYINELRISYAIAKLKTDLTFRKYSIKAIAHEVGFNTTESFSKAFFKNTGIRPSFFIKELAKK